MKRIAYIVTLGCCALLLAECGKTPDEERLPEPPVLVNLDISLSLRDVSPATRAGDAEAATDDEKMRTLRIVVVRPDGTVEHNRFLRLSSAVETYRDETFKVVGGETKRIYLFANEETTLPTETPGISRKLLERDLSAIRTGQAFPQQEMAALTLRTRDNAEDIAGALPMSECHTVEVPARDHACTLFVTRAAVKFSFRITNLSSRELTLTGLAIDKMAREAYYLPRDAQYDAQGRIVRYSVPPLRDDSYYTFARPFDLPLPVGQKVTLKPLYLLEGRYTDPSGDPRNYSMKLSLGGAESESRYFPDLAQLPRNTHVVVEITVGEHQTQWQVDVRPYEEIPLAPGFGL